MKKLWMKLASTALAAALLLPLGSLSARAAVSDRMLRVGLYYGSTALPSANLLNSVGSGYRLGYFDDSGNFTSLMTTSETALTMNKSDTLYLASDGTYSTTAGGTAVGGWYVLLGSYASQSEAAAAAAGVSGAYPAWQDGTWQARVGTCASQSEAESLRTSLGLTGTVEKASNYAVTVVRTGTSQVIFQFDGGSSRSLGVMPDTTGLEDPQTWFKGYKYYGGFRYERINGGNLTVVNMVHLEDYVSCVITWEMGASWHKEALKAQAACARTYAMRNLNKHSTYHFDLCATTDCQAYYGTSNLTSNSIQAAEESEGVCVYYNGTLADTVYSSSNGGASESSENVWVNAVPYLVGKVDPYEGLIADQIPNYNWTVTYTADELEAKLRAKGYQCGDLASFAVTQTTPTGNVYAITFTDVNGKSWSFYKQDARTFLGLRSQRYTVTGGSGSTSSTSTQVSLAGGGSISLNGAYAIDGSGNVSAVSGDAWVITGDGFTQPGGSSGGTAADSYTITGSGWGHGVGMSQYGALSMAKQGYTYDQILKFYYTGVDVY